MRYSCILRSRSCSSVFELKSVSNDSIIVGNVSGKEKKFNLSWLRDLCECSNCFDPVTKQKLRTSASSFGATPKKVKVENDELWIDWGNFHAEPGVSSYNIKALLKKDKDQSQKKRAKALSFMNKPSISFDDFMNKEKGRNWAVKMIHESGMIFVENVPQRLEGSEAPVVAMADRISRVMSTFYGTFWDVKDVAGDAENIAYTSKKLGWHQDLLYLESPPGLQLLHCLEQSQVGGETLFMDGVKASEDFRKAFPKEHKILSTVKLQYYFKGMGVTLSQYRPIFGSSHVNFDDHPKVFYSPIWQGSMQSVKPKNMTAFYESLAKWDNFVDEQQYLSVRMDPGTCVVFDNHRMLHARNEYSGGNRHLQGTYVSMDDYRSVLWSDKVQRTKIPKKSKQRFD